MIDHIMMIMWIVRGGFNIENSGCSGGVRPTKSIKAIDVSPVLSVA